MSDYLHNLIARTLSPGVGVRPQLRSLFEPAPPQGGFTLPVDCELETLIESNPPAFPPLTVPTPFERVPSRAPPNATPTVSPTRARPPRRDVPPPIPTSIRRDLPPLEPNENENVATVQPFQPPEPPQPTDRQSSMNLTVLQPAVNAPPDSLPENSQAASTPPSIPRPAPILAPRYFRSEPTPKNARPTPGVVSHLTIESEEPISERTVLIPSSTGTQAATRWSASPSLPPISDTPRPGAGSVRPQAVESDGRRPVRVAMAAIWPIVPAGPMVSPIPPRAEASPSPTIHVTIGRVEVRATLPPPAGSRAKPTLPPVMSLEDYLGRRAAGGQR